MSVFSIRLGLALVAASLCLGGQVHAQTMPVQYWLPSWPLGFGGDPTVGKGANTYGNFPGFDGSGSSNARYNFPNGWFVGGESGGMGLGMNGINRAAAFGNSALSYQGMQFGYNFKTAGGSPLTVFGGFDTLKYDTGIGGGGPFAPLNSMSGTSGYRAHAGVEFQPTPNVSLSLGFGYTQQQQFGRIDSDINSTLLPGASPLAITGRP
jgi:opacity protein-like surface antigen